jgi:hypothetical protein
MKIKKVLRTNSENQRGGRFAPIDFSAATGTEKFAYQVWLLRVMQTTTGRSKKMDFAA